MFPHPQQIRKENGDKYKPVVCVSTSTIPVTWDGLWVKGKNNSSNLSDPLPTDEANTFFNYMLPIQYKKLALFSFDFPLFDAYQKMQKSLI